MSHLVAKAARFARLRSSSLSAIRTQQPCAGYHEKVIDHYENPRNVGSMDKNDTDVGTGLVGAPACGDVMKLQIRVDEEGKIVDAKFKTFGCGSAIASSSLATEWIKGRTVNEAMQIKNTDIAKELSLPPVKLHCSMLAEDAIKAALQDYKTKKEAKVNQCVYFYSVYLVPVNLQLLLQIIYYYYVQTKIIPQAENGVIFINCFNNKTNQTHLFCTDMGFVVTFIVEKSSGLSQSVWKVLFLAVVFA